MTKSVPFFTHYNRPPSVSTVLDTDTVFVSQADADTVSLSYQLQRYGMDGLQARMEAMRDKFGYADCTKTGTFAELQNRVRKGVEYFEALPSEVRAKFGHRPEAFYEFIESNKEEAVKQGYLPESVLPKRDVVDVAVDNNISQELVKDDSVVSSLSTSSSSLEEE